MNQRCACGTPVYIPYSFEVAPTGLDGHRPHWWHQDQHWRYPPAWLDAFSRYCNQWLSVRKFAYAKTLDERTGGRRCIRHCPKRDSRAPESGSSLATYEVKGVGLASLPAPTLRSPEAKFCNRWRIDPAAFA